MTLRVVKELTGLPINHVVNVDFLGFVRAVDAIGCVYTDVDRRYYHSNVGLPASEQYSEINIKPGYQLLCGKKALEYVRYRHTDTDLVRSARQQDFISSARERVPISKLVLGQNDLIDIFTKYTTSDITDAETMLQVLKLFIASRNAAIKEVHFPAELGPSYVYASPEAIHEAVEQVPRHRSQRRPARLARRRQAARAPRASTRRARIQHKEKPHLEKLKPPGSDGLVPAHEAGEAEAKTVARKVSAGFPVFYPTRLPSGAYLRGKQLLRTHPGSARLPPQGHRRRTPRGLPDGGRAAALRRHPLLRCAGDPGVVRSADPRQPEPDQDDPRARIRDLRRRRPGLDGRLAPRGKHLLGVERPAQP